MNGSAHEASIKAAVDRQEPFYALARGRGQLVDIDNAVREKS